MGIGMHGKNKENVGRGGGESGDGFADLAQSSSEAFAAVCGDHDDAARLLEACKLLVRHVRAESRPAKGLHFVPSPEKGIDDGIAGDPDPIRWYAFAEQCAHIRGCGSEMDG